MNVKAQSPLTPRTLFLVIASAIILFWLLENSQIGIAALLKLIAVTMPLIQGMVIAYVLNLPMRAIEHQLGRFGRAKKQVPGTAQWRAASLALTLLLAISMIAAVLLLVIPQLMASLTDLSHKLPGLLASTQNWALQTLADYPVLANLIKSINLTNTDLANWSLNLLRGSGAGWFNSTVNLVASVFGGLVSIVISLIFAIYLLMAKEKLQNQLGRLMAAVFSPAINLSVHSFLSLRHRIFSKFFAGQFIEALILGGIFFVILIVFSFPYALLISVLIAFTALIPMAGAYIALVVGAFLILLINPWQALAFVIVFLVIQQMENNLIYPRIVGGSIGLPAIWVLVAVVIGGGLFGVLGMILFIPMASIFYTLLRDWTNHRNSIMESVSPPGI